MPSFAEGVWGWSICAQVINQKKRKGFRRWLWGLCPCSVPVPVDPTVLELCSLQGSGMAVALFPSEWLLLRADVPKNVTTPVKSHPDIPLFPLDGVPQLCPLCGTPSPRPEVAPEGLECRWM